MRQFLALELPVSWRETLDERRRSLSACSSGWRWSRIGAIHLTLRFLGQVDPARDADAREAWRAAVCRHAPFALRLGSLGRFPLRGRPRVLWAGTRACRALERLVGSLESAAGECGFAPETREFRPHLTLARARGGAWPTLPDKFSEPLAAVPTTVTEVTLLRSVLDRTGARYTALERYGLEAAESCE